MHNCSRMFFSFVATALLASCGNSATAATTSSVTGISAGSGAKLTVTLDKYGQILTLSSGATLYAFVPDSSSIKTCAGPCLSIWFPVSGVHIVPSTGISAGMLSSVRRSNGFEQLTYHGHELYTYAGDTAPGETSGQTLDSFGGRWYVVSATGSLITSLPSGSTSNY